MVIYNQDASLIIQNQKGVITLFKEMNEYKDCYIDNELAEQLSPDLKKIWDEMFVCRNEIETILQSKASMAGKGFFGLVGDVSVAAYILAKACEYSDPSKYYFEVDENLDEDIKNLAKASNLVAHWDELAKLLSRHEQKIFYLVSNLRNISEPSATPESLGIIAEELLEIKDGDLFADFCCGSGSVTKAIKQNNKGIKAFGYDIDRNSIAVAKMCNEYSDDEIFYETKDLFEFGLVEDKPKFDKIFANYPFGMRIRELKLGKEYLKKLEENIPSVSKATSSDWLFNSLIVDMLSEDGRAVALMTNGSTWNVSDSAIRRYFIENGLIECVVALPSRLFSGFSIDTSMIVFSHNNKGVKLVDASEIFENGRRVNFLNDGNIAEILKLVNEETENSRFISVEKLRENDYVLSMNRYVVPDIADGQPFESVIKRITRGAQLNAKALDEVTTTVPTDMQYLMLANIQNGIIDKDLPYLKNIDKKNEKYCLTNHCLILSKNGYPYKVAVAEVKESQKIMGNGNLYIIELDENKVDPYYLAAFFGSEQGTAALKSITVGATIPNIGVEQLKSLVIPIPALEKQKKYAEEYQSIKDEITMLQLKLEKARNRMVHIIEEGGNK